jgi:acetate kinase
MTDAIIAINAGSTSLKFGAYAVDSSGALPLISRGQVDSIEHNPHFAARDPAGSRWVRMRGQQGAQSSTRLRSSSCSPGSKPTSRN